MSYNQARRRRFTKRQREAFLAKHGARCHWCKGLILPGQPWAIEHLVPRELMIGKEADDDENLAPIHSHPLTCHKEKTRQDIKAISKSNRIRVRDGIEPDGRKYRPPKMRSRGFAKGPKQKIPNRPFSKRGA